MEQRKYMIWLIDDNAIFRLIIENMLKSYEEFPIDFQAYEDALVALDDFSERKKKGNIADLILVDINMPFMTGWEMMDKITSEEYEYLRSSNIYILSSSDREEDRSQEKNYHFLKGYITKPLTRETLFQLIEHCRR